MKAVFLFLFSFTLMAQEASSIKTIKKEKKAFSINHMFTKRSLEDTQWSRNERDTTGRVLPTYLKFDQHIFGVRYKINEKLSADLGFSHLKSEIQLKGYQDIYMGPFIGLKRIDIDIISGSEGLSDSRVGAIYNYLNTEKMTLNLSAHVNIPTGSIEEDDQGRLLPYSGQLGSGTYDFIPKINFAYKEKWFQANTNLSYTLRTGRNDQGYRMGNQTLFNFSLGPKYKNYVYLGLNGRVRDWRNSSDYRLVENNQRNKRLRTIFNDPYIEKGTRWELTTSLRTGVPISDIGVLVLEGGLPIYKDQRSGPSQLETDWFVKSNIVASF